ncbi:MAG TPA: plastocyanin/azurin family copper-binding protein [Rudaea sp.]|jgi:plastocyanin
MSPHIGSFTRIAGATLLALASLLSSSDVSAAQWYVQSGGSQVAFSPQFLTIQAGDTVTFLNLGGYHNAVADDGSFRCAHGCDGDGEGGNGNPTSDLWIATVTFPQPGTVGYFCEPHGSPGSGMFGTIIVQAPATPATPAPAGGPALDALLGAVLAALAAWGLRRKRARHPPPGR